MSYYARNIAHGKAGETLVRRYFISQGLDVQASTTQEDLLLDIDCFVTFDDSFTAIDIEPGTHAVSIKRNDAGAKYGNICFETWQQERRTGDDDTRSDNERWVKSGWWYTGKAPIYAFLQYHNLLIYSKTDILAYLRKNNGWLRSRPLTPARKDALMQVKGYRYDDAICGYLHTDSVRHYLINLKDEKQSKTFVG